MKRWIGLVAPVAVLAVVALAGCEGDRGPAGPPGTVACMKCHTDNYAMDDYILAIKTEYAESQHATGDTYVRRGANGPDCSHCHTTEGYQYYLEHDNTSVAITTSSPIGCFACHAPHTNESFALRRVESPPIALGGSYDRGASNLCVDCHQARAPEPAITSANAITSSRWGPHHGPQANILAALGAHVLPGATYRTGPSHKSISDGCVACHMAPTGADYVVGGHSFKMGYVSSGADRINSKGCVACHSDWTDTKAATEVEEFQTAFTARLDAIGTAMVARGWLQSDEPLINTSSPPVTADDRGAVFNYLLLLEDKSAGVHNTRYAEDVLAALEEYMEIAVAD